jgi:hypothetical protein
MPQLACMADSLAHVQRRPCITAFRRSVGVGFVMILANCSKAFLDVINVASKNKEKTETLLVTA